MGNCFRNRGKRTVTFRVDLGVNNGSGNSNSLFSNEKDAEGNVVPGVKRNQ